MFLKTICIFILSLLLVSLLNAQSIQPLESVQAPQKFYVKLYGGYGLLTPGSFKTINFGNNGNFSNNSSGLGEGLHYGGGIGFIASDFLNLGIDAEYLKAKDLNSSGSSSYSSSDFTDEKIYNEKITSSFLNIIPNITFKALSKPTYYIYNRIGIVLAIHTKFSIIQFNTENFDNHDITIDSYKDTENISTNTKFNINVGIQNALGVQFILSGKLRAFGELVGSFLPISAKSGIVKYNSDYFYYNDPNRNPNPDTKSATTNVTYANSGSSSNPNSQQRITYNVNYIGINIGLVYRF